MFSFLKKHFNTVKIVSFFTATLLMTAPLFAQESGMTWSSPAPSLTFATDSIQTNPGDALSAEDKAYLESVYQDTWNFLSTFVEPTTGIPFDSSEKSPVTSLSNVGLYFGATAIASQTGLVSKEEAVARINMALSSLQKVEKWEGIPMVWFTTRGLKHITGTEEFSYSKHVSNLIGGLVLARNTFPNELGAVIDSYLDSMNFSSMYDPKTGWLKGNYNVEKNSYRPEQAFGPWYYKFLASEARLTSYYGVAKGDFPASHLSALTTPVKREGDHLFFVSAYEDAGVYMPYMAGLYVDERKTVMGASQRNLSAYQIDKGQEIAAPVWGWSAGLDTDGNYIPYGQLEDEIVAPYASMMAAVYYPEEVASNLKALEALGARPTIEYRDKKTVLSEFNFEDGKAEPWAIVDRGDVFFVNQFGELERISPYIDNSKKGEVVEDYDRQALTQLASKIGYVVTDRFNIDEHVSKVVLGSGLWENPAGLLGDAGQLDELLGLASQANLYEPGHVEFTDGRTVPVIFKDVDGNISPWAAIGEKDIHFINAENQLESFGKYAEKTPRQNHASNFNCGAFEDFSSELEYSVGENCVNQAMLGTDVDIEKLNEAVGNEELAAQLVALSAKTKQYFPDLVKFTDIKMTNFGFLDAVNWATREVGNIYLAPSQGMGFLSLANVLFDGIVWKTFAKDQDVANFLPQLDDLTLEKLPMLQNASDGCFCSLEKA